MGNTVASKALGVKKTCKNQPTCAIICAILRLVVSVDQRIVTDGQTDWQTETRWQQIPALAVVSQVKIRASRKQWLKLRVNTCQTRSIGTMHTSAKARHVSTPIRIPICHVWSGWPPKFNRLFIGPLPSFPENFRSFCAKLLTVTLPDRQTILLGGGNKLLYNPFGTVMTTN